MRHTQHILMKVTCDGNNCSSWINVRVEHPTLQDITIDTELKERGWKKVGGQEFCPECKWEL